MPYLTIPLINWDDRNNDGLGFPVGSRKRKGFIVRFLNRINSHIGYRQVPAPIIKRKNIEYEKKTTTVFRLKTDVERSLIEYLEGRTGGGGGGGA